VEEANVKTGERVDLAVSVLCSSAFESSRAAMERDKIASR
jgi:hypothetical protein